MNDQQNLLATLRQLNSEAAGLKAQSTRTTLPYATAISSLAKQAYEQAAAIHLDAIRLCRDQFMVGSVSWKLLDEAVTATASDESMALSPTKPTVVASVDVAEGALVRVKNYGGDFILAEIQAQGVEEEARGLVRSIEYYPAPSGHYGTYSFGNFSDAKPRRGYLWFSVRLSDITATPGLAPDVVTSITFSKDEHGPYKLAQVSGRDLPFVNYHNPSWPEFFQNLYDAGIVVPPSVHICFDVADDDCGIALGVHQLKDVMTDLTAVTAPSSIEDPSMPLEGQQ